MKPLIWSVKELVQVLKDRQANEFDGNIAVSGDRGNGKSSLIVKILYRLGGFVPWKHQVYSREAIIKLLTTQTYSICFDDEAINSGYKRNFQQKGQQELIKILTAYRDSFNIYASAIPNFFSLDKDLRDLYFLHLHVIERGVAVVHMPLQGRLYSQDRWDAKFNATVEAKWGKRILKDNDFKPPFHKLTTFRGYLYFNDLTKAQQKIYKEVKKKRRAEGFETTIDPKEDKEKKFLEITYDQLTKYELTKEILIKACLLVGRKYSSTISTLNRMLSDNGVKVPVRTFLSSGAKEPVPTKSDEDIKNLIPRFTNSVD